MTQLDVMYRFGASPAEATVVALGKVREVYGIRNLQVDEAAHTIRLEYDATRLTEPVIHSLLRRTGLDVEALVPLTPEPPPVETPAPAAAS